MLDVRLIDALIRTNLFAGFIRGPTEHAESPHITVCGDAFLHTASPF